MKGSHIKQARQLLGLTRAELAVAAGVVEATVRGMEMENRKPLRLTLRSVLAVLTGRGVVFTPRGVRLREPA